MPAAFSDMEENVRVERRPDLVTGCGSGRQVTKAVGTGMTLGHDAGVAPPNTPKKGLLDYLM